jgi:hypothetical protein
VLVKSAKVAEDSMVWGTAESRIAELEMPSVSLCRSRLQVRQRPAQARADFQRMP